MREVVAREEQGFVLGDREGISETVTEVEAGRVAGPPTELSMSAARSTCVTGVNGSTVMPMASSSASRHPLGRGDVSIRGWARGFGLVIVDTTTGLIEG